MLRWLWAKPQLSENNLQTLLRVFGNAIRIFITFVVSVTLVFSLIVLGAFLYQFLTPEPENPREQIKVVAKHRDEFSDSEEERPCSSNSPIVIIVYNNSNQALVEAVIQLEARRPGRFENLLPLLESRYEWNHVVLPGHALDLCYRNKTATLPDNLIYKGLLEPYSIMLKEVEPWMERESISKSLDRQP